MKLEVEITEEEIKSAIERKIHVSVAEYSNSYGVDNIIKDFIKKHWIDIVERIIKEEINNSDKMRERIQLALENKIRAQLQAVINKAKG